MTQKKAEMPMGEFLKRVMRTPTCWLWQGTKGNLGYGIAVYKGRRIGAHRLSLMMSGVDVPKGMHVDHLCRVPACVNPAHLEVVTPKENFLRGFGPPAINARKTHCPQGHPFSGKNLRVTKTGGRRCRICESRHAKRRYLKRKVKRDPLPPTRWPAATEGKCYVCKETKPAECFVRCFKGKSGLDSRCRECSAAYMREYRRRKKQLAAAYQSPEGSPEVKT